MIKEVFQIRKVIFLLLLSIGLYAFNINDKKNDIIFIEQDYSNNIYDFVKIKNNDTIVISYSGNYKESKILNSDLACFSDGKKLYVVNFKKRDYSGIYFKDLKVNEEINFLNISNSDNCLYFIVSSNEYFNYQTDTGKVYKCDLYHDNKIEEIGIIRGRNWKIDPNMVKIKFAYFSFTKPAIIGETTREYTEYIDVKDINKNKDCIIDSIRQNLFDNRNLNYFNPFNIFWKDVSLFYYLKKVNNVQTICGYNLLSNEMFIFKSDLKVPTNDLLKFYILNNHEILFVYKDKVIVLKDSKNEVSYLSSKNHYILNYFIQRSM